MTHIVIKGALATVTLSSLLLVIAGCPGPAADGEDPSGFGFGFGGDGDSAGDGDGDSAGDGDGDSAGDGDGDGDGDGPADAGLAEPPDGGSALAAGAALYEMHCASCHGDGATGDSAPSLLEWADGRSALVARIDGTMPTYDPTVCEGECAARVADYILSLQGPAASCEDPTYPPQQLRLLTRNEYLNTVRDLFGGLEPSCTELADCAFQSQSCTEGRCRADSCGTHSFFFSDPGHNRQSVSVAGSFNGWNATAPGYALVYDESLGGWYKKLGFDDGDHQYKLVLDGSEWITDPENPATTPDGFGGSNSALGVSCAGAVDVDSEGLGANFTAQFPVETRPQPFPFDNAASAALVSSVHATESMEAAEKLAALAVDGLSVLVPCDLVASTASCAGTLVDTFAKRAWRRPISAAERTRLMNLITAEDDPLDGARVFFTVLLMSPDFLYKSEIGTVGEDGNYALTPYEIASALSYTFWAGPPDDALYAAAEAGELETAEGRAAQAERLLGSEKARAVLERFAMQWWGTENIVSADKSASFVDYTPEVRRSMKAATERFVSHVIFDGAGTLEELFTADYTYLDPVLAAFYGVSSPSSEGFAQAPALHEGLSGVLGQGSLLATLAYPDQTSPVRRGLFVRQELLCQDLGTPPPNAGAIPEVDPNVSTRERFEQHSSNEACYACHQYIDEVGFGFENYDAVGRYRTDDNGHPIDSTGNMNDVEALGAGTDAYFETPKELAAILVESDSLKTCFVRQVVRFVRGRMEEPGDLCTIEALGSAFDAEGHDIRSLWIEAVKDPSFVTRRGGAQ